MSTTRPYSPGDRGPESDGGYPAVPAGGQVRRLRLTGASGFVPSARDFTLPYVLIDDVHYFADPEGNAWEVAYNPGFPIQPDGSIRLPD
jgi:hypothetical protein